ncbi:MAG: sigma-E factor negative regulatory protein [Sulfurifustaceae bacterium]
MKEKISALIDAELDDLDERRTLNALTHDADLRATWERYHLIRTVMARELGVLATPGLPDRVMARLDGDAGRRRAQLRFWPLAGGFAVAASVAAIAILALQTLQQPLNVASSAPVTVASNGAAMPIAATPAAAPSVPKDAAAAKDIEEPLYPYLVGHNEFMPTAGMGGMLPYVRVVAYPQDK